MLGGLYEIMRTWIALFRGINVGGNNLLPMKELSTMLESIGCSNIRTYIQSGNVVFDKDGIESPQLSRLIGETVLNSKGFEPKVLLLSAKELEGVVESNPFPDAETDPKTLHVFFLSKQAKSAQLSAMREIKAESENFSLAARAFYLHAPDGVGRSRLAAKAEKLLGVDTTARNWRTVSKLLELTDDIA